MLFFTWKNEKIISFLYNLYVRNLAIKTLFNKKIKQTIFFDRMNPFSIVKINKSFTLPIDKISMKQKQSGTYLY